MALPMASEVLVQAVEREEAELNRSAEVAFVTLDPTVPRLLRCDGGRWLVWVSNKLTD